MKTRKEVICGGQVILYRADCLDILPTLEPGSVDAAVTDPPYGIGLDYASYDDTRNNWTALISAVMPELRRLARFVVLPSCQINLLPWWYANFPPEWIIAWHKGSPGHSAKIGFNDWEPHLTWGRPAVPMHDHFQTVCGFDDNGHPCPKPLPWALWLVKRAAQANQTVLDPFLGSGTTLVAAVRLGRKGIGIEKDPGYFAIARKRIETEIDLRDGSGPLMKAQEMLL